MPGLLLRLSVFLRLLLLLRLTNRLHNTHPVEQGLNQFSILKMAPPSIFYHYTSKESLEGILASSTIFCSTPHPATPGLLGGYVIKSGVFLTRMDPNNSKAAIAFNNYRWQNSQPLEGSKIA